MPFPVFVRPNPLPAIWPTVRVLALMATARLLVRVTVPLPRSRLLVPTKVKSVFHVWAVVVVIWVATELSSERAAAEFGVPITSEPVPRAPPCPRESVPLYK